MNPKKKKNPIILERRSGKCVPEEGEERAVSEKAGDPVAVRTKPEARKEA